MCQRPSLLAWSPSVTPSTEAVSRHRQARRFLKCCATAKSFGVTGWKWVLWIDWNNQKIRWKEGRTVKITAWKMNTVDTQLGEWEINGKPLTDPRVLMVGLFAQPEKGLVGPDDVAELRLWSSWRLLANASSQWWHNQPRKLRKSSKSVQVSHGSNKFVMNLNNNGQEIPEVQLEEYAWKLDAKDFACRSKAKTKPQKRDSASSSTRTIPIVKRNWTDVEPGGYSLSDYDISKKLIHLLRHGKQVHRENDGAIEFRRIKDNLQTYFLHCHHWSDDKWKMSMAGGGGNKKRCQYCTDSSGIIVYLRALQGHSGCNLVDPTLQDNVVIPSNFFQYIYHVGCALNLHSIIISGLILRGQNLNNRQTVFFLLVDPMDKNHKDPETIDWNEPRHAQYMHKAWKRHQNAVYWVDTNLALRKGLKFYQTRSNAIILHDTLPAYCIPKVVRMEIGEVTYEKVYMSPRPPPKISLKHDWKRELGSEDAQRPEGQVVQQSRSPQSNQPIPNPSRDWTRQPVVGTNTRTVQDGRKNVLFPGDRYMFFSRRSCQNR